MPTTSCRSTVETGGDNMIVRRWTWPRGGSALLVACGGNDPTCPAAAARGRAHHQGQSFTALVSFGDSLSDVGTYAPATSLTGNGAAPYFGGKFTTNSATATVWVENLATRWA
jgi:outer membrane lipase/esterase